MTRDEVVSQVLTIFSEKFEIDQPELDINIGDAYEFDSIDAIELLREIEIMLATELSRDEKKKAMDIRNINQIVDYIMGLIAARAA